MIHPEDPNKLYTFYFFFEMDTLNILYALKQAMTSCGVNAPPITLNRDLYFEENTVQPNDLRVILRELKRILQIKSIKRNIFDGRPIATYICAANSDQIRIIESLRSSLIKKKLAIDTTKYPLLRNIIINFLSSHPKICNANISKYTPRPDIGLPRPYFCEETYIYYESF